MKHGKHIQELPLGYQWILEKKLSDQERGTHLKP